MISVRKSSERGYFDHGWLKTFHTFSFSSYQDENFMGFKQLRVINEDTVAADKGFGTHSHRDMEIITYVVEGILEHKDSMGNRGLIKAHEVQTMSAGSGVTHSEFNSSSTVPVHLLQIWILPKSAGIPPAYGQKSFSREQKLGKLCLLVSGTGKDQSLPIHQDIQISSSILQPSHSLQVSLQGPAWVQIVRGEILLNDTRLEAGDGASVELINQLDFKVQSGECEFLLFELSE